MLQSWMRRLLYSSISMISQHDLSLNQRYLMNIADDIKKREKDAEDDRKSRQDDIDRLAQRALSMSIGQTFQRSQRISRSGRRTISELDLEIVTSETSRSASLSMPLISSVHSRASIDTASAASLAFVNEISRNRTPSNFSRRSSISDSRTHSQAWDYSKRSSTPSQWASRSVQRVLVRDLWE